MVPTLRRRCRRAALAGPEPRRRPRRRRWPLPLLWLCLALLPTAAAGAEPPATFSLSGTVAAAPATAVDADTNQPLAPVAANNDAATAQPLPNPVTLAGYLSAAATRRAGDRFEKLADPEDWYRLTLAAGDIITLTIADHNGVETDAGNPDFDLYLVDPASRADLQTAEEQARRERLRVLRSGAYLLLVKAHRGAANYQLEIAPGPSLSPAVPPRRRSHVNSAPQALHPQPIPPDDPLFPSQWSAAMLHLPEAWQQTTGSDAVVIALLDSGILFDHPDLDGRLCRATDPCAGYDFVADPASGGDGDGIDADPADPGRIGPANLIPFHGTQLAGVLGAVGNNRKGFAGVDWHARIMPVRVIGQEERSAYDLHQGLRYAAGLSNDSGQVPRQPAKIISLSLGGGNYQPEDQELFDQLRAAGIFVFAAAGNEASSLPVYPAAYAGVVAVSAVDRRKELAPYANLGPHIAVAAPGGKSPPGSGRSFSPEEIITTGGDPRSRPPGFAYVAASGTSIAVPQVAGIAALMLAVDPALTPAEFDALLAAGLLTEDLGDDGAAQRNDRFGYGLLDARKALQAAAALAAGGGLPPALATQPQTLDFAAESDHRLLTLANAGDGSLKVTGVRHAIPWLQTVTLQEETPPQSGLGSYLLTIDRNGLAAGVYSGTLEISTDQPAVHKVTLLMQVGGGHRRSRSAERHPALSSQRPPAAERHLPGHNPGWRLLFPLCRPAAGGLPAQRRQRL